MNQPSLPFAPHRLARTTDPATSKAAAQSAKELRAQHHGVICAVLRDARRPLASEEIAMKTAGLLDKVQVCKRMAELLRAGVVEVAGEYCNRSGRMARRFRLKRGSDVEA